MILLPPEIRFALRANDIARRMASLRETEIIIARIERGKPDLSALSGG